MDFGARPISRPKIEYLGPFKGYRIPLTNAYVEAYNIWISALGLFLGLKSNISLEQNVSIFQFYI